MATEQKISPAALKRTASKTVISTASSDVATLKATKLKLAETGSKPVVLNTQTVRDVAVVASVSNNPASEKVMAATVNAATLLSGEQTSKPLVTPKRRDTGVVTAAVPTTPIPVSKSTNEKSVSILNDAIRTAEEEEYKERLAIEAENEREQLVYKLRASATEGDQHDDIQVNPEDVNLTAMQEEAAIKAAEMNLSGGEPESQEPEPAQEPEAPKSTLDKVIEWIKADTLHTIVAIAVVASVIYGIVKLIKK